MPRSSETAWAGTGRSTEANQTDRMTLAPAKGAADKVESEPLHAMACRVGSLLAVEDGGDGPAPGKKTRYTAAEKTSAIPSAYRSSR